MLRRLIAELGRLFRRRTGRRREAMPERLVRATTLAACRHAGQPLTPSRVVSVRVARLARDTMRALDRQAAKRSLPRRRDS